jgi:ERCC4-related helicase
VILASVLVAGLAWAPCAAADEHVKGVIQALGIDSTVVMRTDDGADVTIVLRDYTKVRRVDGMRQLKVSSTELIPGLRIQASGYYEAGERIRR